MSKRNKIARPLLAVALALCLVAGFFLFGSRPGWTDDRDLLRFDTSKPYLFLILDTSASMALQMGPGEVWSPGGPDNPDSRLFQAKQALYDVFKNVNDLHFGFASYNQDSLRATQKHWLYYTEKDAPEGGDVPWPLSFPIPDKDGLTTTVDTPIEDTDGDGVLDKGDGIPEPIGDIDGDVMTFGAHLPLGVVGTAGSCDMPLDLADPMARARVQSFAIEGAVSSPTTFWL